MTEITVALPEERMAKLNELAEQLGVEPEEAGSSSV
jgi:hypothetical protein